MIHRAGVFVFLFIWAVAAVAQEQPAWTLTVAERVARRLDAGQQVELKRAEAPQPGRNRPEGMKLVIDGRVKPELFLRTELMAMLLTDLGQLDHRSKLLQNYKPWMRYYKWDSDEFWSHLETDAAPYYRLVSLRMAGDGSDALSRRICGSRAAILASMAARYPRFDEFLYRAVAPRHTLMFRRIDPADYLRWMEGGCQ